MTEWIARAYDLPERELAYGTGRVKKVGKFVNHLHLKKLIKLKARHPEMADIYQGKIEDIEGFIHQNLDASHVIEVCHRYEQTLNVADEVLENNAFFAGETYSLADVCWTVLIARQFMLSSDPLGKRDHLKEWYMLVKARPSFQKAGVMEKFGVAPMLRMLKSLLR